MYRCACCSLCVCPPFAHHDKLSELKGSYFAYHLKNMMIGLAAAQVHMPGVAAHLLHASMWRRAMARRSKHFDCRWCNLELFVSGAVLSVKSNVDMVHCVCPVRGARSI